MHNFFNMPVQSIQIRFACLTSSKFNGILIHLSLWILCECQRENESRKQHFMFVLNHSNCVHTMNENKRLHSNNNNNICGCASVSSEKNGPRTPLDCDKKPIHTFVFYSVLCSNITRLIICFACLFVSLRFQCLCVYQPTITAE